MFPCFTGVDVYGYFYPSASEFHVIFIFNTSLSLPLFFAVLIVFGVNEMLTGEV